ncbi:hypothetical protein ACFLZ1_04605 [Patescibacteria group bacterium]
MKQTNKIEILKETIFRIVLLHSLLVFLIAIYAIDYLQPKAKIPAIYQQEVLAKVAKMYLSGPEGNIIPNESLSVDVVLDTNNAVSNGVDVVINFNPNIVRLDNIEPETSCDIGVDNLSCFKTFAPIEEGSENFNKTKVVSCANTGSWQNESCAQGQIKFGAVAFDMISGDKTNPVVGNNLKIATLTFTVLTQEPTTIDYVFYPLNQDCPPNSFDCHITDTNVMSYAGETVDDILAEVENYSLNGGATNTRILIKFAGVPGNNNIMNLPDDHKLQNTRVLFEDVDVNLYYKEDGMSYFVYNSNTNNFDAFISFEISDLPTGEYNLLVKGPSHRQIRFCLAEGQSADYICSRDDVISINAGTAYTFDLTDRLLDFGDVDWDGGVKVTDYSIIKACLEVDARKGDDNYENGCNLSDGNFDGVVDNTDIDLLFLTLSSKTDDE